MKTLLILYLLLSSQNIFLLAESSGYNYSSYSATSTNTNLSSQTISCTTSGQSAVYITSSGITIEDSTITKSGDYSGDTEDSEFYGLNAAVLVQGGSATIKGGSISTSAKVSNVLVATNGGTVTISDATIKSTGSSSARGLHATYGGEITATNVTISSTGGSCATLATDRGEGTVSCTGCTLSTGGAGSPLIYSTGDITVSGTTGTASAAQAVVVEGKNSATIQSSSNLKCTGDGNGRDDECGILIYQSMSGDADTGTSTFTCESSTIEILSTSSVYSSAPFFYVTNTDANINIKNCTLKFGSGQFLLADEGDWGTSGSNGGTVTMTLTNQEIEGDIVVGSSSSLTLTLVNSSIKGTINSAKTASKLDITLDADSTITLTGNSYYTSLTNADSDNSNIVTGSYTMTTYEGTSSSGTSSSGSTSSASNPSSSSSGGTPPEKPGSDQAEPAQSGTPPEKPGSDQAEPAQSGTPPEKPGSDQAEPTQSGQSSSNATTANTTNIISTTIPTTNSSSTNGTASNTNAPINDGAQTSVLLLGYSDYVPSTTFFSFFIYFVAIENALSSNRLTFPINVLYNRVLRNLETKDSVCTLQNSNNGKLQYKCEVQSDTSNIKQITIEPNFNFEGQNVNLAGTTPLAEQYQDNIINVNELNYLKESTVNILDHSKYRKEDTNSFTISGVMSDPQPSFGKTDLNLQLKEGNKEINATCTITDIQEKNYILSCNSDEEINQENLESGYSKIDNNIILVVFDPQNTTPTSTPTSSNGTTISYKHSSSGLSAGAIVGIVIGSVALAGIVAAIAILMKRGSKPPVPSQNNATSSGVKFNPEITN